MRDPLSASVALRVSYTLRNGPMVLLRERIRVPKPHGEEAHQRRLEPGRQSPVSQNELGEIRIACEIRQLVFHVSRINCDGFPCPVRG